MDEFNGLIVSTQLSTMGTNPHKYGYIDVSTADGRQLKFKIVADTDYDTLEIGETVKVQSGPVGYGGILTAKIVTKL
ncbi:MAG: hypothetical protein KAU89_05275 [Candidatus Thorarchaeota archaeon]|nr:hypothetical protein [Candidatus Thorarchaeota archaeon]